MYKKDILLKSLNTEVFKSTFGILLIFFLLVVGSRAVGYFEQASEGIINPNLIYKIIFLRIPDFVTLLIPLSFFLGVLLTISRMYADKEIYAFFSVGLSSIDLIKFLIPQTALYFFLTLLLSVYIAPHSKFLSEELLNQEKISDQILSIKSNDLVNFNGINVLEDESLRQGIKDFSDWPTIPQLYVKGQFIGGCDIVKEMFEKGELKSLLQEKKII